MKAGRTSTQLQPATRPAPHAAETAPARELPVAEPSAAFRTSVQAVGSALSAWAPRALAIVFLVVVSGSAFESTASISLFSDEFHHVPQIQRFCAGDYEMSRAITTFPGYHVVSAVVARVTRDCSTAALREFNVACGLAVALVAFLMLSELGSRHALSRTIAFYFTPLFFPYYFVVFTDVFALLVAMLAVWLALKRNWSAAGIAATLGIAVRQTNVVIAVFVVVMAAEEIQWTAPRWLEVRRFLVRSWSSLLGLAAFAVFAVVNHGVAVGDTGSHEPGLHAGNIFFTLALLSVTSLPVIGSTLWNRRQLLTSVVLVVPLLGVLVLYLYSFDVTHPYNKPLHFLRNALLAWVNAGNLNKLLFFVPIAVGVAALCLTRMTRPIFWAWLPASLLVLVPQSLIEHRYGMIPIAMWTLLRSDSSATAEASSIVINAVLGVWLLLLIATGTWI